MRRRGPVATGARRPRRSRRSPPAPEAQSPPIRPPRPRKPRKGRSCHSDRYDPRPPDRSTKGNRCPAGTSPTSGRWWPRPSRTHLRRCRATVASRGGSSTAGPTASPRCCSTPAPTRQDKVAQYLYNCPEYLESMFAVFKAGLAPGQHQLPLRRRRARLPVGQRRRRRGRVPRLLRRALRAASAIASRASSTWLWVDDGSGPCPDWAIPYEDAAASAAERTVPAHGTRRRRPPAALHRRHHRHAEGRHVAPGRPVRAT